MQGTNQEKSNNQEHIKGVIKRVTFRSEETGFAVMRVEIEGRHGISETLVGQLPIEADEGSNFIARGVWQSHDKFGRQFKAFNITESKPTSLDAITKYLASGQIKGIGEKLAERIVQHFKERTLTVLEEDPDKLSEVPGLGQSKVEEIKATWQSKKEERDTMLFFHTYGISLSVAKRIYAIYRSKSIEVVKTNPYMLCQTIWGIGFLTADKIARAIGIQKDSEERIIAGIGFVLSEAQSDGHTYLPKEILIDKASSLLEISDKALILRGLHLAILQATIIEYKEKFYSPTLFAAEKKAADLIISKIKNLKTVSKTVPDWILQDVLQNKKLDTDALTTIVLSEEQKEAVAHSAKSNMLVITGGPGCGKTTVVKTITSLFKKAGLNIRLAAPTGRAAQKLQEVCGIEASTIHRLLKYDPIQKEFIHSEADPLPYDVLIIDESSMIDIPLAASLLSAIKKETRVIFVGDKDQLPSVGPGLFFSDLLDITEIPRVQLSRLFRRAEESSINFIAHQINHGAMPHIPEPDGTGIKDAYFLPIKTPEEGAELIERLVCDQIPKKFKVRNDEIIVLSPMNQGELGIIALNERLQRKIIPQMEGAPSVKVGNVEFRLGDRVCQRVNNYQIHDAGVYNGEQGIITGIDTANKSVIVTLWDGRQITYTSEYLTQLDLAYALTIHRSQGSEVPVVVMILHDAHSIMLERQLIYTGVTRAKKLLIIVGTRSALQKSTQRQRSAKRYTGFKDLVLQS